MTNVTLSVDHNDQKINEGELKAYLQNMDAHLLKNDLALKNGDTFYQKWKKGAEAFNRQYNQEFLSSVVE